MECWNGKRDKDRNPLTFATRRLFVTVVEPLLWNRKKGTGGEKLEARYIRCSFNKSHVKRRRDRTIGGMGKWILGRVVCLRLKRGGKGEVEDSRDRKGNQLRRVTIEGGRESQREAGVGLWWVRDSSFTEEAEGEVMGVDVDRVVELLAEIRWIPFWGLPRFSVN